MPKLEVSYFDFHGGRGESIRLALAIGGVAFEDHRIPVSDRPSFRERTPLHAVPLLAVDGEVITQSNAINRYVGRLSGLYPTDALEALRCDEVMDAVEDIVTQIVATFGMQGEELRVAREALVAGPLSLYLRWLDTKLADRAGSFFGGDAWTVADLKVFVWTRSLQTGNLDHIPVDLLARVAPGLEAHCERVADQPAIRDYYDQR